jgi:hypothetical protein
MLGNVGLETEVETAAAPWGSHETACVQRDGSASDAKGFKYLMLLVSAKGK